MNLAMMGGSLRTGPRLVNEKETVATFVRVMQEMKWTWAELMDTPIPVYQSVVTELNRQAKKQESDMKKAKSRRGR